MVLSRCDRRTALGIGANAAGFTIVNAAFLRGLPYEDADHRLFVQRRATLLQAAFDPRTLAPVKPSTTLLKGVAGDASSGQAMRLPVPPKGYCYPRAPPDGKRLAFHIADERDLDARGTRGDVWVYEPQASLTAPAVGNCSPGDSR